MPAASAPGKFILFGEHAVVYGKPAIAIAIDLRTEVKAEFSDHISIDGKPLKEHKSFYIKEMMKRWDGKPISIEINSSVPPSSGLGSSAALSVSMIGALCSLKGIKDKEKVAREAFDIEYTVQGGASPTDTSTSALGGAVYISSEKKEGFRWSIERNGKKWNIHSIDAPELSFVIGVTGAHSSTKDMVEKVRRVVHRSPFGMDVIDEIGDIVEKGRKALLEGDISRIGELMNDNHELLRMLGVSCSEIEDTIRPIKDMVYGAKLTGAGGGGSIIALTDNPKKVADRIRSTGAKAYIVKMDAQGLIFY
jgi:mevalonate kinase